MCVPAQAHKSKNRKFCFQRKHLQQCSNNYILRSLTNFTENFIPWTGTANYYWQVISKLLFVLKMNHFVDKLNIKTSAHNHSCLVQAAHRAEAAIPAATAAEDICMFYATIRVAHAHNIGSLSSDARLKKRREIRAHGGKGGGRRAV